MTVILKVFIIIAFLLWIFFTFCTFDKKQYLINFVFFAWAMFGGVVKFSGLTNDIESESQDLILLFEVISSSKFIIIFLILSILGFISAYVNSDAFFIKSLIKGFEKYRETKQSKE